MYVEMWGAETSALGLHQGDTKLRSAGPPIPSDARPRLEAALPERVLQTQSAQHLRGIGAQPDTRAHLLQFVGLLEKVSFDAGSGQREQGGQATEPASYQYDAGFAAHVFAPSRDSGGRSAGQITPDHVHDGSHLGALIGDRSGEFGWCAGVNGKPDRSKAIANARVGSHGSNVGEDAIPLFGRDLPRAKETGESLKGQVGISGLLRGRNRRRERSALLVGDRKQSDSARLHLRKHVRNGSDDDLDAALSRSEEHTSELQSLRHLVCRLLLEKK